MRDSVELTSQMDAPPSLMAAGARSMAHRSAPQRTAAHRKTHEFEQTNPNTPQKSSNRWPGREMRTAGSSLRIEQQTWTNKAKVNLGEPACDFVDRFE